MGEKEKMINGENEKMINMLKYANFLNMVLSLLLFIGAGVTNYTLLWVLFFAEYITFWGGTLYYNQFCILLVRRL